MTQKRHEECLAIIAIALYIVFRNLAKLMPKNKIFGGVGNYRQAH